MGARVFDLANGGCIVKAALWIMVVYESLLVILRNIEMIDSD